jgi:hypothetical protein
LPGAVPKPVYQTALKDSRFGFSTCDSSSNSSQNVSNQGQHPQANQFNPTHRRPVPSIKGSKDDEDDGNDDSDSDSGDSDSDDDSNKNDDGNNGGNNSDDNNNGSDNGEDMYGNPPDMGK